ncbi:hypothetical protein [Paenibacillus humicola]|uniref:hypothetical protein n=1 Tax=Paenibacillus humicola TaxID=3110540 RepID=UPI00237BFC14|nr:hypothetical protein [Paenibacillus humicola]
MNRTVEEALDAAVTNWNAMSRAEEDEAEPAADRFEASFYRFIDVFRDWMAGLDPRPQTMEALYRLPEVRAIAEKLPGPLQLNFETEAELILDGMERIGEDKYD